MNALRLNGIEVRLSGLSLHAWKARPCDFLLPITPQNQREMLDEFRRSGELGRYGGLWISGVADLSFLQDFPNLLYLEIVDQPRVNTRPLECLANLRGLRVETPGEGIDFAWFPELEVFAGDWHADHRNLGQSRELRSLTIGQFKPKSSDLSAFAAVTRLERLTITKTDMASLAAVEALEDLRYLDIAYAPKLTALDDLSGAGIRELALSHAKAIRSYAPLASISHLRRLRLSTCASMPDLRWTQGLEHLDSFSFVETNVEDGDLSPLLELPRLRYVGTMDKKHYNYKFAALNELLQQRARGRGGPSPGPGWPAARRQPPPARSGGGRAAGQGGCPDDFHDSKLFLQSRDRRSARL